VCPGYGISPCGDEIVLPCAVVVGIAELYWTRLGSPQSANRTWLAIDYAERKAEPVPVAVNQCGCNDPEYRATRIADAVSFRLLWRAPELQRQRFDPCSGQTPPCPICPPTCDLVLASIALPDSQDVVIDNASITNMPQWV
jgi:hypothetical protein